MPEKLKTMVEVVDNSKPYEKKKHPEEKEYLVCFTSDNGNDDACFWNILVGRTETYEFIRDYIKSAASGDIDFEKSFVLVETIKLSDRKNIVAFMKYCEQYYPDDNFDIDDYAVGDWIDEPLNEVDSNLNVSNSQRVDMASLMNGEVDTASLE